jgi:hypothetical protein
MHRHLGRDALSGGLAGLVGAACMGAVAVVGALLAGMSWYAPLELVGGMATGSTARFDAGIQAGAAIAGAALHFALGAGWGIIFGLIAGRFLDEITPRDGMWIGAMFGIVVWVIDIFTVMPHLDPVAARAIPLWFGALTNIGYGAVVGGTFHFFLRQQHNGATPHLNGVP